jgi:CIC family chloride channel protein
VLGSTLGSTIGRRLRFQPRQLKVLVEGGAAAGIAAALNAPFAGAFFALEEVLGSFSSLAFSPVVISSVVGALTVRPFLGGHPIFESKIPASTRFTDVLLYPLLGIACGIVSALYSRAYLAATARRPKMPAPSWLGPLLAGAITGLIVAASGGGLGVAGEALFSRQFVNPHARASVRMAGMVADATRAPLAAIFIVFEMTDDYTYVAP